MLALDEGKWAPLQPTAVLFSKQPPLVRRLGRRQSQPGFGNTDQFLPLLEIEDLFVSPVGSVGLKTYLSVASNLRLITQSFSLQHNY